MKKIFVILLALAAVFAGCNKQSNVQTSKQTSSAPQKTTTVKLWHTTGAGLGLDALNAAVEKFNKTIGAEKGIVVDMDYVASRTSGNTQSMEKLMSAIASGDVPEAALLDNFQIATWAAQNAIIPLDDLMKSVGLNLNGMYDWAKAGSSYKGKTYSIPANGDVRILTCNMDIFAEAGLTEKDIPRTIAELEAIAEKLTVVNAAGEITRAGFIPWAGAGRPIYTWGWAFGGDFYDEAKNELTVNRPEIIEAVQWEHDFAAKWGLEKFVNFAASAMSGSGVTDPFVSGKVAMIVYRDDQIADVHLYAPDMKIATSPIPTKDRNLYTTWAGGWGWTIPRGAKNQEATIEFFKFIGSDEGQSTMMSVHPRIYPVKGVSEKTFSDNPEYKAILEVLPYSRVRPPVPVGQMLWDNLGTVLDNVIHDKDTVPNQLNALYKTINSELANY